MGLTGKNAKNPTQTIAFWGPWGLQKRFCSSRGDLGGRGNALPQCV